MPKKEYKVKAEFLQEIDFEGLIIIIPEEEVEDKLAYLAKDGGQITKNYYEDFVMARCVANISELIYTMKNRLPDFEAMLRMREHIMELIFKHNPSFRPESLYINKNQVIKVKRDDKIEEGDRELSDNKHWNVSYFDEIKAAYSLPDDTEEAPVSKENTIIDTTAEIKEIEDLEFQIEQRWWPRINKYINIKKYKSEDAGSILRKTTYRDRMTFKTYVVSICVDGFEELFQLLDEMGITNRATPPTLINEIYGLCLKSNDKLTINNAESLGLIGDSKEDDNSETKASTTAENIKGFGNKKKKGKGKKFKDVPKELLLSLDSKMKERLIGQDEAVGVITSAIQRASVGLKDPVKPIGSFLFAGSTGVGKSWCSKVLAEKLTGDMNNTVTIDCSEYSADHEYAKLIGSPAGYVGFEQGGLLTNAISAHPFSVIVFDEIEKASTKVHELLLQILDEGRLTDNKGQRVPFKDSLIVMTSNVGVKEVDRIKKSIGFGDVAKLTDEKKDSALKEALKKKFKPEFLNRIDSIVNFRTLQKSDYMRIIDMELNRLSENLKKNDTEYKEVALLFDDDIREFVYKEGIDEELGARPLKRCIEKEISTPLAIELLRLEADKLKDTGVRVSVQNEKVSFEFVSKKELGLPVDTETKILKAMNSGE